MQNYKAFTLLELIIVMVILFVLSMISVVTYRSLVDSFAINEVSLSIAQDIRDTQRSAMLLERDGSERWLHGIGIDFTNFEEKKSYEIFKWCSAYDFYDENNSSLTNDVPNLPSGHPIESAVLPFAVVDSCLRNDNDDRVDARLTIGLKRFDENNNLDFSLLGPVRYVIFESVSGKAFFYDENYKLLNYFSPGVGNEIFLDLSPVIKRLDLEISPIRRTNLSSRILRVQPVSGMLTFEFDD